MKKLRFVFWLYIALDLFFGGFNGGFFPLPLMVPQARAQQIVPSTTSTRASNLSFVAGKFVANEYANYGGSFAAEISTGNASTGSSTIQIRGGYIVLHDGRAVVPYAVGVPFIVYDSTPELVTPTSVSGCYNSKGMNQADILVTCTITASFSFTHGIGASIQSGTGGLAEAAFDAFNWNGGVVVIEPGFFLNTSCTNCYASINAAMAAIPVYQAVAFEDDRTSPIQYWNPAPSTASFLAVPATLTATTVGFGLNGANTTGGAYTGASTYHVCVSYVDVMGNEGPCSLDFSGLTAGSGTANQIGIAAPAASTGAVGYTVYISLAGGTYALAYQAPLLAANCTPTKIETVTPACAVANTAYGQSASNAIISALTLNTSPLALQLGVASTTADYVGNSNARTGYAYVPGSRLALGGIQGSSLAFTAGPATVATTVPQVIGTLAVSPNFLNFVDKTVRVCGKEKMTGASATIEQIQLWWDAAGSDATGVPVNIANLQAAAGPNTAATYNGNFCWTGHTTVAGAGVTAGSIQGDNSSFIYYLASAPVGSIFTGGDTFTGATALLNLATGAGFSARLHIVQLHTTGTDVSPQLQNVTVEVLN